MRPEDRAAPFDDLVEPGVDLPFDAELESLHDALSTAGEHARRVLYGRTQPTRLFTNQLRAHLLGVANGGATAPPAEAAIRPAMTSTVHARAGTGDRPPAGRATSPGGRAPDGGGRHTTRPSLTVPPRTLLALLAIASMAGVLMLGALGGTFGPALP